MIKKNILVLGSRQEIGAKKEKKYEFGDVVEKKNGRNGSRLKSSLYQPRTIFHGFQS